MRGWTWENPKGVNQRGQVKVLLPWQLFALKPSVQEHLAEGQTWNARGDLILEKHDPTEEHSTTRPKEPRFLGSPWERARRNAEPNAAFTSVFKTPHT